jgi:hypothetical protein
VDHCEDPGCHVTGVLYNVTNRQITALIDLSTDCKQSIQVHQLKDINKTEPALVANMHSNLHVHVKVALCTVLCTVKLYAESFMPGLKQMWVHTATSCNGWDACIVSIDLIAFTKSLPGLQRDFVIFSWSVFFCHCCSTLIVLFQYNCFAAPLLQEGEVNYPAGKQKCPFFPCEKWTFRGLQKDFAMTSMVAEATARTLSNRDFVERSLHGRLWCHQKTS